jgi:hypothetical protein
MSLTRIDPADFVFSNDDLSISCWRDENGNPVGDTENTPNFIDGGTVNSVNSYYLGNPANLQFSRAVAIGNAPFTSFSRKIYGAIRNIVVGDANADITWGGVARLGFSVISVSKNTPLPLLPGSLKLGIYTDDSKINPPTILNCGRAYNIKEAPSLPGGNYALGYGTGNPIGLFLPDVGLILSTFFNENDFALCTLNPTPTNHVFIRARNNQYNYSTNPSFISGSSGKIIYQDWFNNPQTYITTVGLYNDNNELMATAKLPRPYNKNFQNELLIQVGLNF